MLGNLCRLQNSRSAHLDLKMDNIMLSTDDETMCKRHEQAIAQSPPLFKEVAGFRRIYQSNTLPSPRPGHYGLPILCDLGEVWQGRQNRSGPFIQPQIYRAPEVIFGMAWGPAIDIWNLAGLVSVNIVSASSTRRF